MNTPITESTEVRAGIDVPAPPERAFDVFTTGFDGWWPRSHHVGSGELKRFGVDPHVGGRMWEENAEGDVCVWGRVLEWEPGQRFAFSWLIGPDWGVPADGAPGSRVSVTFTPHGTGTRVELVHDRLDVHGAGWTDMRAAVGSEGGWPRVLTQFAAAL